MNLAQFRKRIKPWMLPIAMVGGVLFHDAIAQVAFLTPYMIFAMLLITFCKVRIKEISITGVLWLSLVVQIGGALVSLCVLSLYDVVVAQGIMICFLCPTASAAPVVTGMLGGSVSRVTSFSIISNIAVAIIAPILFAQCSNADVQYSFVESSVAIVKRVAPLLVVPMFIAMLLQRVVPKVNDKIATHQGLSFYLWAIALFIVVGRAVSFIINEPSEEIPTMIIIALGAGVACVVQFWVGRKIGYLCGDKVAMAQGLGQKNTILAIWMALTWLHPLASVGPAAYIMWQNIINSTQLYRAARQ